MNKATGTVKFFNSKKAYGFIHSHESKKDVFVHATGLIDEISENDVVEFDLRDSEKGVVAINVKIIEQPF